MDKTVTHLIKVEIDRKTAIVAGLLSAELTVIALAVLAPDTAAQFLDAIAPWARLAAGN